MILSLLRFVVVVLIQSPILIVADRYMDYNGTTIVRGFPISFINITTSTIQFDDDNDSTILRQSNSQTQLQLQLQSQLELQLQQYHHRDTRTKIIGGDAAKSGEYPSFAFNQCGGTLIRSDIVLTAAHCISLFNTTKLVYIGGTLPTGGEAIAITKIIPHPRHSWETNENDIMIVKLACKSRARIQKLNFNSRLPAVGSKSQVIGFGSLVEGGQYSPILRKVNVSIVSGSDCAYLYAGWVVDSVMICAGDTIYGNKDACGGDSGGPLLSTDGQYQYGIVSFGYGCGLANYPGIYTRISPYRRWIESILRYNTNRYTKFCSAK
jgi:trypsin